MQFQAIHESLFFVAKNCYLTLKKMFNKWNQIFQIDNNNKKKFKNYNKYS